MTRDDDPFFEMLKSGAFNAYLPSTHQIAEGRTLVNVHPEYLCEGRGCVVHHPSDHKMKMWPKDYDTINQHFWRYCQHRKGHPDVDDTSFWKSQGRDIAADHNEMCDGCCKENDELW